MSSKNYKTFWHALLVVCAFLLVMLYLFFTDGVCGQMMNNVQKILCAVVVFIIFVCLGILVAMLIWTNDKNDCSIFCCDSNAIYVLENSSSVPTDAEKVVVCSVEDLEKLSASEKLKEIYILNPHGSVQASVFEKFKKAKIHFCQIDKTFCCKEILECKKCSANVAEQN